MSKRRTVPGTTLDKISELLCDEIASKSDDEIIADVQGEYLDPHAHARHIRAQVEGYLATREMSGITSGRRAEAQGVQQRRSAYRSDINWTNRSVRKFASGAADPIEQMEASARAVVLKAMDKGWSGPPFDPIRLAEILGYEIEARSDVKDARVFGGEKGRFKIEFNPGRPRGRIHFSIAHEIAHTFFPDCRDRVRYRERIRHDDEWQIEALCNVGAAELLMPVGSFGALKDVDPSIEQMLDARKKFEVSAEAILIRYAKLTEKPCAAFCSAAINDGAASPRYRLDYLIASRNWDRHISPGRLFSKTSPVQQCVAIGFTSKGIETGLDARPLAVEAVGLPPYPNQTVPRVAGILYEASDLTQEMPRIAYVRGDALTPRGTGKKIIAHVVNDKTPNWGGAGFASAVRRKWPSVQATFARKVVETGRELLKLGGTDWQQIEEDLFILSMVAQHGYGPSEQPRIRYAALEAGLRELKKRATTLDASVHLPRIGAGNAGGSWAVIEEMIEQNLINNRIPTTVYDLPD